MLGAIPRRPGLPYVPSAMTDELLGAWLLRIAELYGLSLRMLLARLDALKMPGPLRPPWFRHRANHSQISQPVEFVSAETEPFPEDGIVILPEGWGRAP